MYISNDIVGVVEIKDKGKLKQLFCKHKHQIEGEQCSRTGMTRVSGNTIITACTKCSKVINKMSTQY